MRRFTRVGFLLGARAVLFKTLSVATADNSLPSVIAAGDGVCDNVESVVFISQN